MVKRYSSNDTMADSVGLLSRILILFTVYVSGDQLSLEDCQINGFTTGLMCSSCNELKQFSLRPLIETCESCCTDDEESAEDELSGSVLNSSTFSYHLSVISICRARAFVKSDRPKQFPGLKIRYVKGSDPFIRLLNEERKVMETLSIEKWNTDSVEEFLNERLRK
ncbi:hypothetical protein LSH36_49g06019 [Paralvinella palmiformis]|uniref:Selenoprotein F n=1 Tax=Paralvinella palmiformis TaxID=53620 RepID=A0AAD9K659_9ANNE|nr:hypothetical protein LSH36_49g06019 [Paralvinella palmiformis]